jgi:hypothetical protein
MHYIVKKHFSISIAPVLSRGRSLVYYYYHHQHRPLIPLCGVGTTCFLLPLSSITRHVHAHATYFHVIYHTIHYYKLRKIGLLEISILRAIPLR